MAKSVKIKLTKVSNGEIFAEDTLTEEVLELAFETRLQKLVKWVNKLTGFEDKGQGFVLDYDGEKVAFSGGSLAMNALKTVTMKVAKDNGWRLRPDLAEPFAREVFKEIVLDKKAFQFVNTCDEVVNRTKGLKTLDKFLPVVETSEA